MALSALVWLLPPTCKPKILNPCVALQSSQHSSWFAQPVPGARPRDVLPPLVYRGHCPITPFCRPGLGDDAIQYYSVMFIVCSRLFSVAARFLIHLTYLAWTVIISSSFCNEEPVCPFWVTNNNIKSQVYQEVRTVVAGGRAIRRRRLKMRFTLFCDLSDC